MRIDPVYAMITGYVTYPGPNGPVNSALPGPCGTHRYFATVQASNEPPIENHIVIGSPMQCWQPGLHVQPLPITRELGNGISGHRITMGTEVRYVWFYRELPTVGPCNPPGGG